MSHTQRESYTLDFEGQPERTLQVRAEWREPNAPAVLVLHGFKGFMDWGFFPFLQHRLADAGLCSVAMNVSGSGIGADPMVLSEEDAFATNTYTRELEDVERLYEHVRARHDGPWDASKVGVFGHSRGGGMALLLASRRPVDALTTWSAIDSCDRLPEDLVTELRERGQIFLPNARTGQLHRLDRVVLEDFEANREALNILSACARIQAPALIAHGQDDPAVETAAADRIHAALGSKDKALAIEGEGHTFGAKHPLAAVPADLDRLAARTASHFVAHLGG